MLGDPLKNYIFLHEETSQNLGYRTIWKYVHFEYNGNTKKHMLSSKLHKH